METLDFSRVFLSLALVVFLIWLSGFALKRLGIDRKLKGATGSQGRLQVVDVLYLDPKRRVVLLRADTTEYLLLVSGDSATVIDTVRKPA